MSRAFRCDALDTPQGYISNTKISHKNRAMEIWELNLTFQSAKCWWIWVVWDPYGVIKRDIWAKMGPLRAQKGPDTRAKCVVTMSPTQAGQSGAVGTKSGPPVVLPSFTDSCINGPAAQFLPVAFGHFRPFPRTRFGPRTPETGPKCLFASTTQQSYGKRVT